jgi:hypothetical protein
MSDRFDKFVTERLIKAGWFECRKVESLVSDWKSQIKATDNFEMFSMAEEILNEFGGIKVEQKGLGKGYPRTPFEINPALAIGEADRLLQQSQVIKQKLYPLGEVFGGYYFLTVGEDGRVFGISDHTLLIGNSFDEALNNLIIGIKPQLISN